jgi:hypothetical protein
MMDTGGISCFFDAKCDEKIQKTRIKIHYRADFIQKAACCMRFFVFLAENIDKIAQKCI